MCQSAQHDISLSCAALALGHLWNADRAACAMLSDRASVGVLVNLLGRSLHMSRALPPATLGGLAARKAGGGVHHKNRFRKNVQPTVLFALGSICTDNPAAVQEVFHARGLAAALRVLDDPDAEAEALSNATWLVGNLVGPVVSKNHAKIHARSVLQARGLWTSMTPPRGVGALRSARWM